MAFKLTPTLETQRLSLNPFNLSHVEQAVDTLNTPQARRYLGGPKAQDQARAYFLGIANQPQSSGARHYAITLKSTETVIGTISLDHHHDLHPLEVSYVFGEAFWGFGYAREALSAFLDLCKDQLKLDAVVAETQPANLASCKFLESTGFSHYKDVERFGEKQVIYWLQLNDQSVL